MALVKDTLDVALQEAFKQAMLEFIRVTKNSEGKDVSNTAIVAASKGPPPYGQRQGWYPRGPADFADGGAFPEIHVPQYPMEMGKTTTVCVNNQVA